MTSEDRALFLLGKLMGATELFLEEMQRFTDMDDTHGKLIFIPQGQKGKSWHDAFNGLVAIRAEISKTYKMPEDWEVFAKNIDEEVFRKLDESGRNFHDE